MNIFGLLFLAKLSELLTNELLANCVPDLCSGPAFFSGAAANEVELDPKDVVQLKP